MAKVKARNPLAASWVHSVVATDRHVVLIEAPIYFNLFALLAGTPAEHVVFDWKPKTKTRVTVVPLGDPQLARSFVAPPFMWCVLGRADGCVAGWCRHPIYLLTLLEGQP